MTASRINAVLDAGRGLAELVEFAREAIGETVAPDAADRALSAWMVAAYDARGLSLALVDAQELSDLEGHVERQGAELARVTRERDGLRKLLAKTAGQAPAATLPDRYAQACAEVEAHLSCERERRRAAETTP